MEYLAHLNKEEGYSQPLQEHLSSVARLVKQQIPSNVQFDNLSFELVQEIAYWVGYLHDLGKYSDYFQDYLIKGKASVLKNHAHISACYAYNFLSMHLENVSDKKLKKTINFLAYLCIRQHHSFLTLEGLFSSTREKERWENLKAISTNLIKKAEEILNDSLLAKKVKGVEFLKYLDMVSLEQDKRKLEKMPSSFHNGRIKEERWYFFLIYLFSLLIDLDKLDSAQLKVAKIQSVAPEKVVRYLRKKHGIPDKTELLDRREKARQTMLGVINSLDAQEIRNKRFFTLTAPTGIGKTLASLQTALRLQERIKEVEGYTPRIITAIPFINIIEQTQKDYEQVLGKGIKLVTHHRLADFSAKDNGKKALALDKSLLEVEAWEGDVILTTFVQLFQSLFTGKNKLLKKINKLAGSIVILDEAQALPEVYMPLIGGVLQKIAEYYGTRFILMTATQPRLLEFGDLLIKNTENEKRKSLHLLPDYPVYFQGLKRTKFVPLLENKLDTDEFVNLVLEKWDRKESVLLVVNTIKRSIDIYKKLKKILISDDEEFSLNYLSTNIIPLKRRQVIQEVKEKLKNNEPVILVSTQTIEAGVDLDFHLAFRDFAPLDSLIQTAGRVNREGKKGEYLPVYIVQLENDNNYVYDLQHRQSTIDILKEHTEILEPEYGKLADQYYSLALERGVSDESRMLWEEGILKLNFSELENFKLIANLEEVVDVFVENGSERASLLADAYEQLFQLKEQEVMNNNLKKLLENIGFEKIDHKMNLFAKKALLRLIMAKLSNYIIQVRASKLKKNKPIEFKIRGGVEINLFWIPPNQLSDYYAEDTGFVDETGKAFLL